MACNSCSTEKDGKPGGCRSNGTCGTGGCNKLNVYNWLSDMVLPHGQKPFEIIEVRFKGSRKEFYHNKENIDLRVGDVVTVDASPGHDVGVVSMVGELVRFQLKKKHLSEDSDQIKTLYRKAKPNEVEKWLEVKDKETPTLHRTREIIQSLKLSMKLSDIEFQGDGKKATFFYTAEERVDFRELIKKLADEFRIRIDMRQIGMRQEASRLGGIGVCGRELCCSTWLTDFKTVSTSTARYQNLALNPAKLAGQCGKLKCCLNYELDSYVDALKDFPSTNTTLETEHGRAFHRKTDIFKRMMWFAFHEHSRKESTEGGDAGGDGNWIMLPVDRVNEIIALNKQKIKPPELRSAQMEEEEAAILIEPDYANVVGQDRIDRMDHMKKKKKKKKKKKSGTGASGTAQSNQGTKVNNPQQAQQTEKTPRLDNKDRQQRNQQQNKTEQNPQKQNQPNQQGSPNNNKNRNDRNRNRGPRPPRTSSGASDAPSKQTE
ncbi:MAG TPA: regulatory iron-sulfur-containing complex subunit RicT [Bacteroidia bacterium]|nr:regulatory iron-sulfur-containing complex subunit RicT [Bacteroidia bacterium]HNS13670.1 regulatory iron-sulfur-containing complex subunit RicT [Bacteroidia bacterium]